MQKKFVVNKYHYIAAICSILSVVFIIYFIDIILKLEDKFYNKIGLYYQESIEYGQAIGSELNNLRSGFNEASMSIVRDNFGELVNNKKHLPQNEQNSVLITNLQNQISKIDSSYAMSNEYIKQIDKIITDNYELMASFAKQYLNLQTELISKRNIFIWQVAFSLAILVSIGVLLYIAALSWAKKTHYHRKIITRYKTYIENSESFTGFSDNDFIKTNFLRNMSYQLRTPIDNIIINLESILNTDIEEGQRNFIHNAYSSCEDLHFMINEILDYSLVESKKLMPEQIQFDIISVVESLHKQIDSHAKQNNVSLNFDTRNLSSHKMIGDPHRVKQIMLNLLSNAVKFSHNGKVSLTLEDYQIDEESHAVKIIIADTGMGIPKNILPHIFEKFSGNDHLLMNKKSGIRLGLPLTKLLVDTLGGKITATSVLGEGTKFTIILPLNNNKQQKKLDTYFVEPLGTKILLITANSKSEIIFRNYIERWGANYTSVPDNNNPIGILKGAVKLNHPYDTVLIDDECNKINVGEFAAEIKNDVSIADTELLLISSSKKYKYLDLYQNMGYLGYLIPKQSVQDFKNSLT